MKLFKMRQKKRAPKGTLLFLNQHNFKFQLRRLVNKNDKKVDKEIIFHNSNIRL